MERATKTSLAIKMKMRAFFNFSAFISTNSPKMESWGRICSCVYVLQTSLQKELCPLDMQNLFFFIYLLGLLLSPSMSPSSLLPDLSMCVNGYESEHILVKTPAIFSLVRHVCYSRFSPLMNCFVSLETEMWVERQKKVLCFRKKNYFKELRRVE